MPCNIGYTLKVKAHPVVLADVCVALPNPLVEGMGEGGLDTVELCLVRTGDELSSLLLLLFSILLLFLLLGGPMSGS